MLKLNFYLSEKYFEQEFYGKIKHFHLVYFFQNLLPLRIYFWICVYNIILHYSYF
jgi:hypothetical protein